MMNEKQLINIDKAILQMWYTQLMNVEVKGQSVRLVAQMLHDMESLIVGNLAPTQGVERPALAEDVACGD